MPETTENKIDQQTDNIDKRVATNDRPVTILTTSGEYQGNINLNLSNVQINRVSDLFVKSNIAFLPLYNATVKGLKGKEVLINIKDIAVVIPNDDIFPLSPELRKDAIVSIKLKYDLGELTGKVNLWGETQQLDRISDLLNFPGKKWLILYEASYKGEKLIAAIINLEFISTVDD
jgi:hypothetical protein